MSNKKKVYNHRYRNIVPKEVLYQEFASDPIKYKSIADLYRKYWYPLSRLKIDKKIESPSPGDIQKFLNNCKIKPVVPESWYQTTRGYHKRREVEIKIREEKVRLEVKRAEEKKISDIKLKDYVLDPMGFAEDFKLARELMRYNLKRISLKVRNALKKVEILQLQLEERLSKGEIISDEEFDSTIPEPVYLSDNEANIIRFYKTTYETMRTAFKLPVRYNANIDDREDRKSFGEISSIVDLYMKSGGVLKTKDGDDVPIIDVNFNRGEARGV